MENKYKSLLFICFLMAIFSSCKKEDNPIKYKNGIFSDSVTVCLDAINSSYDDYNSDLYLLEGKDILVFSSNRNSAGANFDVIQANLSYSFNQTTGAFSDQSGSSSDDLTSRILNKANTSNDDLGPNRFFCGKDGYEYFILSTETDSTGLDLFYLRNTPEGGEYTSEIYGPAPITRINTSTANEGYFSFNLQKDTAYFCSDKDGRFDIYMTPCDEKKDLSKWLSSPYSDPTKVDILSSIYNDKCPYVYNDIIVFASDRPGGIGGYDLYYSYYKEGAWTAPINFGPEINTEYDEYRPVIGFNNQYSNLYMIFSSNRPGGKGGFDLYFRGLTPSLK